MDGLASLDASMGIAHETRERGVKTKLADDDDNDNLCDGTASTAASSRRMPLIKKPRRFVGNGVAFPFLKADGGLPSSSTKDEVRFNAENCSANDAPVSRFGCGKTKGVSFLGRGV